MNSSHLLSFAEQAGVPAMDVTQPRFQNGVCGFNIDGRCISGGTNVAGNSGYRLASMGYPSGQAAAAGGGQGCSGCHEFPLWYKSNSPYELQGVMLKTSRLPLVGPNLHQVHAGAPNCSCGAASEGSH